MEEQLQREHRKGGMLEGEPIVGGQPAGVVKLLYSNKIIILQMRAIVNSVAISAELYCSSSLFLRQCSVTGFTAIAFVFLLPEVLSGFGDLTCLYDRLNRRIYSPLCIAFSYSLGATLEMAYSVSPP